MYSYTQQSIPLTIDEEFSPFGEQYIASTRRAYSPQAHKSPPAALAPNRIKKYSRRLK